ncbi:hypothetical protein TBLA_0D01360 [Henningerozyma blattae CBS 6284]|uniref:Integrase catalytic domain-containing protein n=1 Tax=Henningerozyma blattae (strain ATCC 34711 / CBS 6284 / DSM 70876 / NBRC 10599 / NRRL Y-10934 / UCD 77-7) TaxID=1071380 RepID=I2H2P2_HENB6|nr:hypothetical protein TBLA_0D01360 [Tetrapisispora blattae CBS 6284]CCH60644.1 hypothetical protein TBLA_0D01360 [Tetrapisispora blattae CBS 6284]
MPTLNTIKSAQSFLGMVNYYRNFIPQCSLLSKPIIEFISKKCDWSKKQDQAVITLKQKLCSAPVLVPFIPGDEYRLSTDASTIALGGVLERLGQLVGVIGYFSKTTQAHYPVGEIELLSIIQNLQHFKYYLHGHHFILRTDHISLLAYRNKKEPSARISRWLDFLAEFDFTLEYIKGSLNHVADALSRPATKNEITTNEVSKVAIIEKIEDPTLVFPINSIERITPVDWYEDWIQDPWSAAVLVHLGLIQDVKINPIDKSLFDKYIKKLKLSKKAMARYKFDDQILYYDDRVCVPCSRRTELLNIYHDNILHGGHFGEVTTINKICPNYYWPSMTVDIRTYIKGCLQCQIMKKFRPKKDGQLEPLDIPQGRWLELSIDFVTGLPTTQSQNDMIMVVVDRFSKRAHFIATQISLGSVGTLDLFYRFIFAYHGFPRTIASDRDIRFTSSFYKEVTERLGIKLLLSSSNHPQTDGQTESVNKTLGRLLRSYCSQDQDNWGHFLPQVEFVYNSTFQRSIRASPFEVDLGYIPNEPLLDIGNELLARNLSAVDLSKTIKAISLRTTDFLKQSQEDMESHANETRTVNDYKLGEYVLLHRDAYFTGGRYLKIQPIFLGPFKIVKIGKITIELDLPSSFKKHRVINIKWIKEFVLDKDRYPKSLPRTSIERIQRAQEIIAVIGYDVESHEYYCKMKDVDPTLTCTYSLEEFNKLTSSKKSSLLNNFNTLVNTN